MDLQILEPIYRESSFLVCPPELVTSPLAIICPLALQSILELTPIQWKQIEIQLLQHQNAIFTAKHLMPQVFGAIRCKVNSFQDTS